MASGACNKVEHLYPETTTMTQPPPNPFLHPIRDLIGCVSTTALSDGQLLERFLTSRDETAVEALVRRYGPLVLGVCRRVLRDTHTAEDAFQATFLVLVRKAPSLDRARPLGSYLYTVAYRLALRARANDLRRQRCETQAARSRPAIDDCAGSPSDLAIAVEEELHRLPEKHRAALVLCYLEGKTNEQAAQILGCPRGSMAARLDQAREQLREKLARRGFVAPSAAIAAALTAAAAHASVPLPLRDITVRAALWFAREETSAASFVSSGAVALARGVFRATFLNRLKTAAALLLAVATLATGAAMLLKANPPPQAPGPIFSQAFIKNADGPDADGPRANAALHYGQAFIALRRGGGDVEKLFAQCLTMPLDTHARQIVTRSAYALRMMQRGSARPRCDWTTDSERGIDIPHSRADGARALAARACLRTRMRFEEGKSADAIEDALSALTLARHVSLDGTLDSLRAGQDVEQRMGETLALYLPRLDAGAIKNLKKRLASLPAGGSVTTATTRMVENLLSWIVGEVKEAPDRESLLAFLAQLSGDKRESAEKRLAQARAFLQECGGTSKGVIRRAEQARPGLTRMAKKLELPPEQLEKEWTREEKELGDNPVFKLFAPVLHGVRVRQARAHIYRALLSAALAVGLDGGQDALKKHFDPLTGGAFEYVAFKGGFELRSKWRLDEKLRSKWKLGESLTAPVTLTVGRRE
jgi:RNA polymerase sigma factor (sigma-70 family)